MPAPLCFVLMPFGLKKGPSGMAVDFDDVFARLVAPAIRDADLVPFLPDKESDITQKPLLEHLLLCPFAVIDLTLAGTNVYYQLGFRHATRLRSTVLVAAEDERLALDVPDFRIIHYKLDGPRLAVDGAAAAQAAIAKALKQAPHGAKGSPVVEVLDYVPQQIVDHERTDVFRRQVDYSESAKARLAEARRRGPDAVRAAQKELGRLEDMEAGVLVDLALSYRAVEAHEDMVALIDSMPRPLADTVMIQEQRAFALNRLKRYEQAESVLLQVIRKRGPGSETFALLGRIYKDQWQAARKENDPDRAVAFLEKAIGAYLNGFETDWRDAYPGVNAVALMELMEPPHPRRLAILPIVRYAVERKIARDADYWDYASLLELAMIELKESDARDALRKARSLVRESWEPKTTLRNLQVLRETREARGVAEAWMLEVEAELTRAL